MSYATPAQLSIYNSDPFAKAAAKREASKSGMIPQGGFSMDDWYASFIPASATTPTASTVTAVPATTATSTSPGNLSGERTNVGSSATGWTPVIMDPLAAAQKAIEGANAAWPSIAGLAGKMNAFNQATALNNIIDLYPQFTSTTKQLGANVADWSAGNISQSSKNQMAQRLAERGISSGMGSYSPSNNAALMAVLGKTTEGLQGQALAGYNSIINALPKTTPVDTSKWMVGAGDIFNAQNWANLLASAPNSLDAYNLAMANANRGLSAGYGAGASGGGGGSGSNTSWLDNLIGKYSTTPTTSSSGTGTTGNVSGGGGTSVSDYGYGEGQFNPDYFQLDASGSILPWYGGITNPTGVINPNTGNSDYWLPSDHFLFYPPSPDTTPDIPQIPDLSLGSGANYGQPKYDIFDNRPITLGPNPNETISSNPFDNWTDEDWGNYYGDIYPELYY